MDKAKQQETHWRAEVVVKLVQNGKATTMRDTAHIRGDRDKVSRFATEAEQLAARIDKGRRSREQRLEKELDEARAALRDIAPFAESIGASAPLLYAEAIRKAREAGEGSEA